MISRMTLDAAAKVSEHNSRHVLALVGGQASPPPAPDQADPTRRPDEPDPGLEAGSQASALWLHGALNPHVAD